MRLSFCLSFNRVKFRVLYCKQFLDKRCGVQVKCGLDGYYILQEVGVRYALLILCIMVFEVNNLNN
jgi:hypothetical protein